MKLHSNYVGLARRMIKSAFIEKDLRFFKSEWGEFIIDVAEMNGEKLWQKVEELKEKIEEEKKDLIQKRKEAKRNFRLWFETNKTITSKEFASLMGLKKAQSINNHGNTCKIKREKGRKYWTFEEAKKILNCITEKWN